MEVILRPLTPYLLPGLLALPLILRLARALPGVEDERTRIKMRTILLLTSSYFLLNLPYSANLLVEYGLRLSQQPHRSSRQPILPKYTHPSGQSK